MSVIEQQNLLDNATQQGEFIVNSFKNNLSTVKEIIAIRSMGLMIGIELNQSCGELVKAGLDQGILINVTADKIIRLLPPLILNKDEAAILIATLTKLIQDFLKSK